MDQIASALAAPEIGRGSRLYVEDSSLASKFYRRDVRLTRQAKLEHILSDEIIPRLLRLHADAVLNERPAVIRIEALAPATSDVSGLVDIVIAGDLEAAGSYVMVLRDRGFPEEALFTGLLEPAARHLGEMWDRDECDFVDVTLGVGRLQKMLAIFNNPHEVPDFDTRRRVLMAMTPGDQHYFGVAMVERFLLAAGWHVQTELSSTIDEIVAAARCKWFAVAGLTAGSDRQLETLKSTIDQLREQSMNPAIGIMVGGPLFTANPELAAEVGADATASDGRAAVLTAQKLFDLAAAAGWVKGIKRA